MGRASNCIRASDTKSIRLVLERACLLFHIGNYMNILNTRRLRSATQRTLQPCMLRRGLFTSCCILSLGLVFISSRPACALERISDEACSHVVGQVKYYPGSCASPGGNFCAATAVTCAPGTGTAAPYSITLTAYTQCSGGTPGNLTCRRGTRADNNGAPIAPNINVVSKQEWQTNFCSAAYGAAVASCPQPNCY